mgnify:FL=1
MEKNIEVENKSAHSRKPNKKKHTTTKPSSKEIADDEKLCVTNKGIGDGPKGAKGGGRRGGDNKAQRQTQGGTQHPTQPQKQRQGSAKANGQRQGHTNSKGSGGKQQHSQQQHFADHISPDLVQQGLLDGSLFAGKLKGKYVKLCMLFYALCIYHLIALYFRNIFLKICNVCCARNLILLPWICNFAWLAVFPNKR